MIPNSYEPDDEQDPRYDRPCEVCGDPQSDEVFYKGTEHVYGLCNACYLEVLQDEEDDRRYDEAKEARYSK